MRREICGECGAPISDDGACGCTELLKRGWRLCAKGQKTTQWCAMAETLLREQRQPDGTALLRQALEAENERLRDEVERLRTDGASAVRWAPGSAYWSKVLVALYGPDARKGIDVLERRWQAALERADKLAEALRELEEREQRDEALLRQALEALDLRCGTHAGERKGLIPALRERLWLKD